MPYRIQYAVLGRRFDTSYPTGGYGVSVIQNSDFYFEVEDSKTKLIKEMPYELLKDEQKKQLDKNNEANMTLYNALPLKNCKIDLLTQDYENFSISNEETIDVGFTRFNAIRAKVTAIEESKDLDTLPLDELIGNLKVYEMVLDNDGVASNTTKEKVKSLAFKAKITRDQTSDDSDCQGESIRFEHDNRFGNGANRFGRSRGNSLGNKGGENSKQKGVCYNCGIESHFASECTTPKENKAFVKKAWSDSEDGDEILNDATCLMAIDSQEVQTKPYTYNNDSNIVDLRKKNEELLRFNKEFTKTFEIFLKEKRSLESKDSKLLIKINDLEIAGPFGTWVSAAKNGLMPKKHCLVSSCI
ncbi:zf-CCHC domain-containing protein [Tanacetum coccineum]|uniref:Zf-CCHC domain-containing protein n=1 Tax=Tanacetum coccineum TaxID=301880 RepID=A0ABQ5E1F0_9ASTR